jgi:2'-5' RNA ligase
MPGVPPHERRTALLVEVPVPDPVDDFRRRHLAASVARGLPAHITVLFPFASPADVDAELLDHVAAHFSTLARFDGALTGVGLFDDHVWLAPDPHERFSELLHRTHARFPGFPPYGDAHAETVPHLTIAERGADETIQQVAALAERELTPVLPFSFTVDRVGLFEERADGAWHQSDSFELG